MNKITLSAITLVTMLLTPAWAEAAPLLKPFIMASRTPGNASAVAATAADTVRKLEAQGFQVVGRYSPYPGAEVIAVTDDQLKTVAAASSFGAYGAAERVAVTAVGGEVQVSYTNPPYLAAAYRMKGDVSGVASRLASALGNRGAFGAEGISDEDLREYRYMFGMEEFTDPDLLASYRSQAEALAAVEKNLAAGVMGVGKVYRIDIPGKAESVFGVSMSGAKSGGDQQDDAYLMSQIDFKPDRSTAHLPYEMVVSDGKVYSLSARFRIAIDFPDLSMMGSHSFLTIMGAPDAIHTALAAAAGGGWKPASNSTASNN